MSLSSIFTPWSVSVLMSKLKLGIFFFFFAGSISAQDSLYTRRIIQQLCSESCYGRGYVKKGLQKAETILLNELKSAGARPFFSGSYLQSFFHSVNVFDGKTKLILNGKKLEPGRDYIPDAAAPPLKGRCLLTQKDSLNFVGNIGPKTVRIILKNKLTWTVARKISDEFVIELDRKKFSGLPQSLEMNYQSHLLDNFESRNVGCELDGTSGSDSVIVFSAHYDHLGGIGSKCYFPGANDNASGVSMVLNLLRYYKQHPPKYRTVFLFFAGEEAGLLGSLFFTSSPKMDLSKIKFLINLDLLGTGEEGIMVVNGALHQEAFDRLTNLNKTTGKLTQIKKRGKAANSDHYWFTEKGVPCFFIYTMGGISAYHDVYDRPDTLPLTRYRNVFQLLTAFVAGF